MSTCPSKNIHSLYIDNELTQSLRHKFEKHLSTCESCTEQIKKYSALRNNLASLNEESDIESGYDRLKLRLRYKTTVAPHRTYNISSFIMKLTPVLATAAVIALFFPFISNTVNDATFSTLSSGVSLHENYLLPSVGSVNVAPMQVKGVIIDEELTLARINSNAQGLYTIQLEASKFTEMDVFMPSVLKDDEPIEIILFDSPAVVLHETDNFGLSNPVFLLRE